MFNNASIVRRSLMDYTNYIRPDNITRVKEIYYMDINIGPRIAALRKSKTMTQEQLALALGVSPPAVSKWETGVSHS